MSKRKQIRTRGKIKFSEYFKKSKKGDKVAVKIELAENQNLPKKMQGKTGEIEDKQGDNYIVKIKDLNKEKKMIIHPVHLKKLK